jgi:hypothetical protein
MPEPRMEPPACCHDCRMTHVQLHPCRECGELLCYNCAESGLCRDCEDAKEESAAGTALRRIP